MTNFPLDEKELQYKVSGYYLIPLQLLRQRDINIMQGKVSSSASTFFQSIYIIDKTLNADLKIKIV